MIPPEASEKQDRIASLDAVRGFAVVGILLMNIVAMGMPAFAYLDPTFYGTEGPADMAAWGINYVLSDGKMRALFTLLFGASMALIAERAEAKGQSAAETHYRRMFWLFLFGMLHAWLFWFGDILVQYAAGGALAFLIWRWQPRALWVVFAAMLALQLAQQWEDYRLAALFPPLSEAERSMIAAQEVSQYRGGWSDAFAARAPMTAYFQMELVPKSLPETIGYIALGIILLRNGFLTGAWSRRGYVRVLAAGYLVAAPLHLPLAWLLVSNAFDAATVALTDAAGLILRPVVALAHASAVILLVQGGRLRWLSERLEAAGRMAFSNYLGTTILATTFFYGYGFGQFGALSRAELYWVVLGIWVIILAWSRPWLDRYRYGPLEWLWRTLARGQPQPMRKAD